MIELRSVSNDDGGLESAAVVEEPRKVLHGASGSAPVGGEGAGLLVRGKGEPIELPLSDTGLESVIGTDDRRRIETTDENPWRMICALRIKSPMATAVGTGWLAGPRTVVTAGHCVYDKKQLGGWATTIELSPGRNGSEFPFESAQSGAFSTLDRWIEERDPDFDIGAIHLAEPIGEEIGWFSTGALPADELTDFQVNISGYPADRGKGRQQWFHANRILQVSDRRIFYDVDTFGGQSGSPVWIHEDDDSDPLVVGVHAYGVGGTPSNFVAKANSAPRILPEVLDQIEAWVAQNE